MLAALRCFVPTPGGACNVCRLNRCAGRRFPSRHFDRDRAITLIFVGLWLIARTEVTIRPRSTPKAIAAGLASGVTTMVTHSRGPPVAMYLLPLELGKGCDVALHRVPCRVPEHDKERSFRQS